MIQFGKNITSANDMLTKVPVQKIWNALRSPKPETEAHIRQLRIVRNIDYKRYSLLKRQLPYIVCGIFAPPYRRSENFAYIEYFMLDIDKLSEKQISLTPLRERIEKDPRVMLSFVSPSEDGLKVMFKLNERCYDKGLYSLFYKVFARQFSTTYGIDQVIDNQTCDVTRACFVSVDPEAYYNPYAETIQLDKYIATDNAMEFFAQQRENRKNTQSTESEEKNTPEPKHDVDDDIMRNIKAILNPKAAKPTPKEVFVPEQLNEIMDDLKNYITQTGVEVTEIVNISYGKKIRMKMRLKQAEVNLFYGKKGFSVVKSPRTGTDGEFNDIAAQLIQSFLFENT